MRYLLAVLLPPLAILFCGKIFQAIFNFILLVGGFLVLLLFGSGTWLLCVIHALFVVHNYKQDKRTERIIEALKSTNNRNGP